MRSREFLNNSDELEQVIRSERANEWITYGPINLYIRVGLRFIEEKRIKVIDLATFEIPDEKLRGQGHFSKLLIDTEQLGKKYGYGGIYIELILNPTLITILRNKGFRIVSEYDPPSMYKEI